MTTIQDLERKVNLIDAELARLKSDTRLLSTRVNNRAIEGESLHIRSGIIDALQTVGATVSISNLLARSGEPDNYISLAPGKQSFSVGGLEMLRLRDSAQKAVEIGASGNRDVDVILNDGQVVLTGDSGHLNVANNTNIIGNVAIGPETATQDFFGLNVQIQANPDDQMFGTNSVVDMDQTSSNSKYNIGLFGDVLISGNGNLTNSGLGQIGTFGDIRHQSSSTVTKASGVYARVIFNTSSGTGTITTARVIEIANSEDFSSAAGTITTLVGLYIHDIDFATTNYAIYSEGGDVYIGGNTGHGVLAPQGKIHSYGIISGFMIWEYDGLNATERTMIPNGSGDVLYRLQFMYALRDATGAVSSGIQDVSNNANEDITVGTNTVNIKVYADGHATAKRTAGSNSIKIGIVLLWL